MSEPQTTPQVDTPQAAPAIQPGDPNWLADAPELDFNKLFSEPSVASSSQTPEAQTSVATVPAQLAQPAVQPTDAFLTAAHTVYKSKEEAIKGTDEKDQLIEQLRGAFIQNMGVDPISGRIVPRNFMTQAETNFAEDPKAFVSAIVGAVEKKDDTAYVGALKKFVQDAVMPILEPVRPLLQNVNRQTAVSEVSKQVPEFSKFMDSAQYKETLETVPILKDAISQAEANFNLQSQLPQLYKLAHLVASGLNTSQIVRNAENQRTHPSAPTNPSGRPTVRSSSLNVPAETDVTAGLDYKTAAGRKAIIEQLGPKLANANIDDIFRER